MTDAFERAANRELAEKRQRRERRARGNQLGFRIHLAAYIGVQLLLIATWTIEWQLGGTGHPWFVYPLFGWGAGLAAHYAAVRDSFGERAGGA